MTNLYMRTSITQDFLLQHLLGQPFKLFNSHKNQAPRRRTSWLKRNWSSVRTIESCWNQITVILFGSASPVWGETNPLSWLLLSVIIKITGSYGLKIFLQVSKREFSLRSESVSRKEVWFLLVQVSYYKLHPLLVKILSSWILIENVSN